MRKGSLIQISTEKPYSHEYQGSLHADDPTAGATAPGYVKTHTLSHVLMKLKSI